MGRVRRLRIRPAPNPAACRASAGRPSPTVSCRCRGSGVPPSPAVADIGAQEREDLETALARHFVAVYGAPDLDTALPAAREEIGFICDLVADAPINTVFTVRRFHDDDGEIREEYRTVAPPSAPIHTRIWDVVDDHDA